MCHFRRGRTRQEALEAAGEREERGDFATTAAMDRVYLSGPGGHL